MEATPRKKRTADERVAMIDANIKKHEAIIEDLKAKREALLNPPKKATYKSVLTAAKDAGITPEEMMKKLGVKL